MPGAIVEAQANTKKIERLWWIANTSLVFPAVVLLIASFYLFQTVSAEREQIAKALVQERSEIATQRDKFLDRYVDIMRNYQEYLSAQARHFEELNDTETQMMEEKLKTLKGRGTK